MGISLNGLTPANTYQSLIKVGDNSQLTATLKTLSDGFGTDLPMEVSTSGVNFTGTLTQNGLPITTTPSGVAGAIQFSDGSAFASDASNLFWDDTNKRLGIGTNVPTATTHIKGIGTTSATTSLLVQNSSGTELMSIDDDGAVRVNSIKGITYQNNHLSLGSNAEFLGFNSITAPKIGVNIAVPSGVQAAIKGSGSTSATTSLLVQNSAGTNALQVRDDLRVIVPSVFETGEANGFTFNSNTITTKINGFLALDRNSNRQFKIVDTSSTFNYLILQTSSSSNFADISFNTDHLAIKKEGNIGIGTSTPNSSSLFDITSTTKGFLPPRMTTTQKNAISTPASGLMVYDTDTNKLCCYNGTSWNDLF